MTNGEGLEDMRKGIEGGPFAPKRECSLAERVDAFFLFWAEVRGTGLVRRRC